VDQVVAGVEAEEALHRLLAALGVDAGAPTRRRPRRASVARTKGSFRMVSSFLFRAIDP
jgi:hypothetical protein